MFPHVHVHHVRSCTDYTHPTSGYMCIFLSNCNQEYNSYDAPHPFLMLHTSDSPEKTASYSLYVIGSNGVLREHILQPQKLSTAMEGEDAPIELTRIAKTCWRLLG